MNVLSQYGVGTGAGSGRFAQASFVANVANQLTDTDIQSTIQQAINAGQIPEPPANNASQVLVIFLDENTEVNDANLGIAMLIAEFGEGSYQPVAAVGSINEAREIAASDIRARKKELEHGGEPACPAHAGEIFRPVQFDITRLAARDFN